jgi:proton-dependent oligopeptide transporter, POT family
MPTTLTLFAAESVNNHIFNVSIPAAQYQSLNSLFIIFLAPIITWGYQKFKLNYISKFTVGLMFYSLAFLILWIPPWLTHGNLVSPLWLVISYLFQSAGELLIYGLGFAMVVALCPYIIKNFAIGLWFLVAMLDGMFGTWVAEFVVAVPQKTAVLSLQSYSSNFGKIGFISILLSLVLLFSNTLLKRILVGSSS